MSQRAKVLFVLTSQATVPATGSATGFYLPELVHPYNAVLPHADIVVASPAGGEAPVDPSSVEATKDDEPCVTFLKEKSSVWKTTAKLESLLGHAAEFAAIFYVGGHGRKPASFICLVDSRFTANQHPTSSNVRSIRQ